MEHIFAGYPYAVIVDDILFFGHTEMEHNDNLERVLEQAIQVNFQASKTKAICEMPESTNATALQRFVDMVNYMGKFIPILS